MKELIETTLEEAAKQTLESFRGNNNSRDYFTGSSTCAEALKSRK